MKLIVKLCEQDTDENNAYFYNTLPDIVLQFSNMGLKQFDHIH